MDNGQKDNIDGPGGTYLYLYLVIIKVFKKCYVVKNRKITSPTYIPISSDIHTYIPYAHH